MPDTPPVPSAPGTPFLTAAWRHLLIANYAVEPAQLAPLVPAGTELDRFQGRSLVSVVGFRFLDTRLGGIPIPWHRDFEEVNLRFYVRRRGPGGAWRRGVTFVREFVPKLAIAIVARLCYNEPYRAVPMRHRVVPGTAVDAPLAAVCYEWRLGGRWHAIGASVSGPPVLPDAGSEAEFTIEHYWGYTTQRDGSTTEYSVQHTPWRVWPAEKFTCDIDPGQVYGSRWAEILRAPPTAVLVAEGSTVAVFPGRRLEEIG